MGCLVRVGWVATVLVLVGKVAPVRVLGLQVEDGPNEGERCAEEFP